MAASVLAHCRLGMLSAECRQLTKPTRTVCPQLLDEGRFETVQALAAVSAAARPLGPLLKSLGGAVGAPIVSRPPRSMVYDLVKQIDVQEG